MNQKPTLVIGASENTERYSNKAIKKLRAHNHPVSAIGIKQGSIDSVAILTGFPELGLIHTITIYIRPELQHKYYDYILHLKPKRIIFNPGTENPELEQLAAKAGIETTEACTLVMLSIGAY